MNISETDPETDSTEPAQIWDSLKRSLRLSHDSIDSKLIYLHKLKHDYEIEHFGQAYEKNTKENIKESLEALQTFSNEVRAEFKRAQQLLDSLSHMCEGKAVNIAQYQRLQNITLNYTKEFEQTYTSLYRHLQRKQLLQDKKLGHSSNSIASEFTQITEDDKNLLQENYAIHNTMSFIDQAMAMGHDIVINLNSQRQRLYRSKSMLNRMSQKVPAVRALTNRIKSIHIRNVVVLALVFNLCLLIILIYTFSSRSTN